MSTKTLSPTIPPELWRKSPRPGTSMTLRLGLAGSFALAGLILPEPIIKGVCLGLAVLSFVLIPVLGDRLLAPIEKEVGGANRSDAGKLLRDIGERWAVRWFAPSAWLAVQQARLQLNTGDPRAAAMSYFEARRASALGAERPELTSAEADAHLHADDRKQALKLLRELEGKKSLAALDHVNLGVALLSESGQSEAALRNFEEAQKRLGDHPRIVAGLALARQRVGDLEGARELLEGDEDLEHSEDRTARELAKRARKALKEPAKRADFKKKKKRKSKKNEANDQSQDGDGVSDKKASPKEKVKGKPKSKKARRAARREARKQREAEERANKVAARERQQVDASVTAERASTPASTLERPESKAGKSGRPSQIKTAPVSEGLDVASIMAKPAPTKRPPPKRTPTPPKAGSLFGSMFSAPPKKTPAAALASSAGPTKSAGPKSAAPKSGAPSVPSLDDLFGPSGGKGSKLPAPPAIGGAPLLPPPPVSAPPASPAPPSADDWGSALDLPLVAPLATPPKKPDPPKS